MTYAKEPIACGLPLREAASQALEWTDLHKQALSREEIPHGYAVTYPEEMADVVEDLAQRESKCCGWLSIVTSRTAEGIRLELASDHPDAAPVLALLAGDS